jgi:hypothetical protein
MKSRVKKIILLLLAAALLFAAGRVQQSLNQDRNTLGLTRAAALKNAPPMLAFTTVALGGFRGLISNFLWMRASSLQQDDKFFEAAQLADWITELEPTYDQVWAFQAWNMAWNISVKFKDFGDRWRWVQHGIQLLRDDGLRYNPNSVLLHQQLAWIFQSKIGQNLDDANMYYKMEWARDMEPYFGADGTNINLLVNPPDASARTNREAFEQTYKMNPALIQQVNEQYGPFDWRLPEASAIYWAAAGLERAKEHPNKVKAADLIQLRRVIYQSMLQAFHEGHIIEDPITHTYSTGPNLDLIPNVNKAYETMMKEDAANRSNISMAHRNFLRDAVYFLYVNNRMAEARKWFNYLAKEYPDKPILENDPNSLPRNLTLDEYAVAVVQIDIGETSQQRVTSAIQGLLTQAYYNLAIGENDRFQNFKGLALRVYESYTTKIAKYGSKRIPLPPFNDLNQTVLNQLLDRQRGMPYAARAVLRTQLGLPAETAPAPSAATATNAVEHATTNSVSP